ncbi:hypothetical protein Dimus_017245 [Dionaea muscipula]
MEKRLRSSLQTSAESFLSSAATNLTLKSSKSTLKSLIHTITPSSALSSSLPLSLHSAISNSINSFKNSTSPAEPPTPHSPPNKRPRRSSRSNSKIQDPSIQEHKGSDQKCIFNRLQIYSHIALHCATHPSRAFSPEDLLPSVRELHDNLILFESDCGLLSEVSTLCEEWWKEGFVGREMLISQFLPFLLSRSLTLKKKVDVHRVYAMREAFVLFDFEDESIGDLKLLLIRCVIAPLYLKTEDGRRFIAFTFGLNVQLLKEGLAMIKSQIPFGRKSVLEAYGDIVFRSWKSAEGDLKREIEDGFLQGLIEGAICASSTSFAASVRRVLGGFINQRTTNGVEKLLFRMAEPVIFRSLQVANSNVRHNALHLLLDMFPLEDPDATKEAKDTLLDKQFFLLEKSLSDDCPDVRAVAVEGCCRILHLFWEIIPSSTITKLLTKIFDDMSHDVSNEVRLSTLNGTIYLLANPQSHEVLKVLLSRLGHMILDSFLAVRLAMCDLLLLLRDIRGFQFNKVVALDSLLANLTNDQPLVAQKLTKLLMSSYFPSKVCPTEACNRFITLIKRSPSAGARFCEFAVSEGASKKFLIELVSFLVQMTSLPDNLSEDQVDGILAAVSHLCNNLANEASSKDVLKKTLSGEKLKNLLAVASGVHAKCSVFNISSAISSACVPSLLEECVGLVSDCGDLSGNSERQAEVRSAHKLILSCSWFEDMFESLMRLLQTSAIACHKKFGVEVPMQIFISAKRKKRRSTKFPHKSTSVKKPLAFEDDYRIAVGICWQIKELLISECSRKILLDSEGLELAFLALKALSEVSIAHCMCHDFMDASLVVSYSTISLQIALQNSSAETVASHSRKKTAFKQSSELLPSLNETMEHLLHCALRVLQLNFWANPGSLSLECEMCRNMTSDHWRETQLGSSHKDASTDIENEGSIFTYGKRMSNMVKVLTAVLKFIVDAADVGFIPQHYERCLRFASTYFQNVITCLRQSSREKLMFQEEQLREMCTCLRSCFSYGAKLLSIVLSSVNEASPATTGLDDLANDLLDLIAATESYCGDSYAAMFIRVAKQWLPDLILALGSRCMLNHSPEKAETFYASDDDDKEHLPSWLTVLAKIEIHELSSVSSAEEATEQKAFPIFNKLVRMMIPLLQANNDVLDVIGLIFFISSKVGLLHKDYGLVLGLVHFVCTKLLGTEDRESGKKLNLTLTYLRELHSLIERSVEELSSTEDGYQELLHAKALLQPLLVE